MNKIEAIVASVFQNYSLQDIETKARLIELADVVTLSSGDTLLRAGTLTNAFYIIVEGCVRYFYNLEVGKERNKAFFREGQIIGSLSAFYTDKIIRFNIEAIEPCTLLRFPYKNLRFEGDLERILHGATKELFIRNEQREATLLTGTAEERYLWVQENEPWLLKRIPQYHLASYLRLEPVSLSRIKTKLSNE